MQNRSVGRRRNHPAIGSLIALLGIALLGIGTMIGVIGTLISRREGSGSSGALDVPESFGGNP